MTGRHEKLGTGEKKVFFLVEGNDSLMQVKAAMEKVHALEDKCGLPRTRFSLVGEEDTEVSVSTLLGQKRLEIAFQQLGIKVKRAEYATKKRIFGKAEEDFDPQLTEEAEKAYEEFLAQYNAAQK